MKLTKLKLEQIIKEELAVYAEAQALVEQERFASDDTKARYARTQREIGKRSADPDYAKKQDARREAERKRLNTRKPVQKTPAQTGGARRPVFQTSSTPKTSDTHWRAKQVAGPGMKKQAPSPSLAGKVASTAIGATSQQPRQTAPQKPRLSALNAGRKAYKAGNYDEAAKYFGKAYNTTKNPKMYYNIALASMKGGNIQQAADFFVDYLTQVPNDPGRKKIIRYIKKNIHPDNRKSALADLQKSSPRKRRGRGKPRAKSITAAAQGEGYIYRGMGSKRNPSNAVVQVQKNLCSRGFKSMCPPDGIFGRGTQKAVQAFQRKFGAKKGTRGIVGPETASELQTHRDLGGVAKSGGVDWWTDTTVSPRIKGADKKPTSWARLDQINRKRGLKPNPNVIGAWSGSEAKPKRATKTVSKSWGSEPKV